jgi:phosphoribosylformylglycinamidine (FGAM) synthase-like amidotransferase family enzyme
VKMGLLPNLEENWLPEVSLIHNESGQFIDQWVAVSYNQNCPSVWTKGMVSGDLPIRHGEGRFVVRDPGILEQIHQQGLVALSYQSNPNGSLEDIAGICDPTGRVLGLMPHPEAFTLKYHHPHWRRRSSEEAQGLKFFQNAVDYIKMAFFKAVN